MDFEELLRGAREGDQQCFGVLWRTYNPLLVRFLTGLAGREDALDLASDVWLDVVRNLSRFDGGESGFRAWLFTVGRHRLVDLHRLRARRPQRVSDPVDNEIGGAGDPADEFAAAESTDAAIRLIGSLPHDQAEVVLLRFVADLDVAAVAKIVGKTEGAVRVISHRGLKRLSAQLSADAPVHDAVTT